MLSRISEKRYAELAVSSLAVAATTTHRAYLRLDGQTALIKHDRIPAKRSFMSELTGFVVEQLHVRAQRRYDQAITRTHQKMR